MSARDLVGMGALEARIMRSIWDRETTVTVRDVYEELLKERRIAYTTCMTVMGNLVEKGLLVQDRSGTAYRYDVTIDGRRDEVCHGALERVLKRLLGGDVELVKYFLMDLDTVLCDGCGREYLREATRMDAEGLYLCPACWASCEERESC